MKRIDWKTIALFCGVVLGIGFIFRNSLQPGSVSHQWSSSILNDLIAHVPFLFWLTEKLLRKLAHLTEYAVVGVLLALLWLRLIPSRRLRRGYLLLCALIPCVDELIQRVTPNRTSRFSDVCIDWFGMLCGAAVVWVLLRFRNRHSS